MQGIEPQSMDWESRMLTTKPQVLVCVDLNFDDKIKIIRIGYLGYTLSLDSYVHSKSSDCKSL